MSAPTGPEFSAPSFQACYRHPDRQTGIVCQRCKRPICGECMNPASVGFQCPQCSRGLGRGSSGGGFGGGSTRPRSPRTRFGGAITNGKAPVTKAIMIAVAALALINLLTQNLAYGLLAMDAFSVLNGEVWRLVTWVFLSYGLFATALNLFVLFLIGQNLEAMLGSGRFLALYLLVGVGGATVLVVGQSLASLPGASVAIIGLLAANATVKLKQRESIAPDLGLLAILVGFGFVINSFGSAGGAATFALVQIGSIIVGGLVGLVLAFAPREQKTLVQSVGILAVFVVCVAAIVLSVVLRS